MKVNKRLFAIALVAVMVVGGLTALLLSSWGGFGPPEDEGEEEPEGFTPYAVWPNTHVTNTPEANNEPTIVVNPTDPLNIVAGSNDYGTPSGDAWVGFYASFDGGQTWERGLIPGYNGDRSSPLWLFQGTGDPVLAFASNGDVYMAGIAFQRRPGPGMILKPGTGIFVARSTDGGRSFPQVVMVIQSVSLLTTFHDKEWIAVDPTNGDVHVTWTAFNLYGVAASIVHSKSTDGGQTWTRPKIISEIGQRELQVQGSQIEVDEGGILHVSWIDFNAGSMRYTRSRDKGSSFESVKSIAPVVPLPYTPPNGNYRTPTMGDMDVDRTDGNRSGSVYIAWPDHATGEADILFIASYDGGDTWTTPARVNQDPVGNGCDQWFPAVCVAGDGSFQVFYYDRRDSNNTLLTTYVSVSYDGGATFTDVRIGEELFDGDNTRGPFIGDYLSIDDGPGWSVVVWCDAREGSPENPRSDIWIETLIWAPVEELPV
ncbi:MAG: sialidase family protein [Candidatus Thermoplasmatota archaeon]|nr:sialidase family protein [Candidatus Thermoplasmatota archaeon]